MRHVHAEVDWSGPLAHLALLVLMLLEMVYVEHVLPINSLHQDNAYVLAVVLDLK